MLNTGAQRSEWEVSNHLRTFTNQIIPDTFILWVAYLVAIYLRRELPFGKYVGTNYEWYRPELFFTIFVGVLAAYGIRLVLQSFNADASSARFWTGVLAVPCSILTITTFLPRQSGLEKLYFALSALVLVALVIPWPRAAWKVEHHRTILEDLHQLWTNRGLLRIWVRYNVQSRYAQAVLGILWIVLLPLSTAVVLSIVFSHFMRVHLSDAPFITFFLAGLVPYSLFSQGVSGGMRSILGNMGLMNQIYFPREIIVLTAVGEALVDAFFMFIAMLCINGFLGIYPNGMFTILPLVILIELSFTLGCMFISSYLSVFVRDIPQLVSVILQIMFYMSPIIYPLNIVPQKYQFIITLNPIAALIQAYHNIIVYNRAPDWWGLVYPAAMGTAFLLFGYRVFKDNEDRFADFV